jgi:hypothetical protein
MIDYGLKFFIIGMIVGLFVTTIHEIHELKKRASILDLRLSYIEKRIY